jgi:hypothetical protein
MTVPTHNETPSKRETENKPARSPIPTFLLNPPVVDDKDQQNACGILKHKYEYVNTTPSALFLAFSFFFH